MTALTSAVTGGRTNRGAIRMLLVVIVAVVVVGALSGSSDRPYQLDDPSPLGYAGLRQTLERLGASFSEIDAADVGTGLGARADTLFVPQAADGSMRQLVGWRAFAESGGRVVLGGQRSAEVAQREDRSFEVVGQAPATCDIVELEDLRAIEPSGEVRIAVPAGALSCYGNEESALVVAAGRVTTVAGPGLFTNEAMRPKNSEVDDPRGPMPDNVVVAQRLLAPRGTERIAVVVSGLTSVSPAARQRTIWSQMSDGVRLGLWQLVVAAILFAVVSARRLGRIVVEPQPVPIAGSELVSAVGNLMERRQDPAHAAMLLRSDLCERLGQRLGLGRAAPIALLAPVVASRTGRSLDEVTALIGGTAVTDDSQLVDLSRRLDQLRQEILGD